MAIEISNRQRLIPLVRGEVSRIAAGALAASLPQSHAMDIEAVVAFVRDPAIKKLNAEYRGRNLVTDVLSFPAAAEHKPNCDGYLGDVVISADAAVRQAGQAGHSIGREINELVIHGILHLCGYDHESDQGQMNRLELKLRRALLDSPRSSKGRLSSKNGY